MAEVVKERQNKAAREKRKPEQTNTAQWRGLRNKTNTPANKRLIAVIYYSSILHQEIVI